MPTKTEIIEAGARVLAAQTVPWAQGELERPLVDGTTPQIRELAKVALTAMLPLIKERLVAELEAEGYKRDVLMTPDEVDLVEELVGIVERFEL